MSTIVVRTQAELDAALRSIEPRHRAAGKAVTRGSSLTFRPRHCAGQTTPGTPSGCMHNHPGEAALPTWPRTAS